MIVVGILGDIGSGKSFVSKQFKYPVFNADNEVNNIYKKNKDCFRKLKKKIPDHIKSFPIDKFELTELSVTESEIKAKFRINWLFFFVSYSQ